MSFRKSFSGFRKKVKDKLSIFGDETGEGQVNAGDEELDHPTLSAGVVVGGEFGGDIIVGVGKDELRPSDSLPVSQSAVGLGHDQGGSDDKSRGDVGRNRVDHPPHSDAGNVTTTTPSVSQVKEPKSTWTALFLSPPLMDDTGNLVVPDPALLYATVSKDKSDWKNTASSAAKLFLRTVERASDAFPPLKSVAAGLCAILDNCEVPSIFVPSIRDAYSLPSEQ